MSAKKKAAKAQRAAVKARYNPYVQRIVDDEDLRDNIVQAYESSRDAFGRLNNGKSSARSSCSTTRSCRRTSSRPPSRSATRASCSARHRRSGARAASAGSCCSAIVGGAVALAVSEGLRKKVLDALFGAEEEFEYTSTTTATPSPDHGRDDDLAGRPRNRDCPRGRREPPSRVSMEMHPGQLTIAADTVRALVDAQFPQWRGLPVRGLRTQGTVNALFRLGDRFVARFPLQRGDAGAAAREADAARELAGRTRFATPEPVAIGEPGEGYPMPWSVQTWIEGAVAPPAGSAAFAEDLAELIGDLRAIDTRGRTFSGSYRGGHLPDHDEWMATCLDRSEALLDVPALRRLWAWFRELPRTSPDVMAHGDLIPGNVLVAGGRLVGVIDVGGFGPADPALDLVAAWHLLDDDPRAALREALGSDDLEWARGAAWAFEQAMGLVWYYDRTNPAMAALGRRTLERLVTSPPPTPAHRARTHRRRLALTSPTLHARRSPRPTTHAARATYRPRHTPPTARHHSNATPSRGSPKVARRPRSSRRPHLGGAPSSPARRFARRAPLRRLPTPTTSAAIRLHAPRPVRARVRGG